MEIEEVEWVELFRRHKKHANNLVRKARKTEILNKNVVLSKKIKIKKENI